VIDPIERAVVDHARRTAETLVVLRFFGWLKEEAHCAVQVASGKLLPEQVRHAEQDRGVGIVTTCVHHPWIPGSKRQTGRLIDRQGIHIGTDADRRSVAVTELSHDTGFADAGTNVDAADFAQCFDNQLRGSHFLERKLWMRVDFTTQTAKISGAIA
jgi:hypothetical protein